MPVEAVRFAGAVADVAVPAGPGVAGVRMAGFRGRADRPVELRMVPYPEFTIFIDFGDVTISDGSGAWLRGGVAVGPAPGTVRGAGREVDLHQIRLSPVVAHALARREVLEFLRAQSHSTRLELETT